MSINFIQNKYIFISSLSNTYLFDQTNLTLLDSFGKENKRYIMDIYYRNDNNLLYVLSYNDLDKDIYKIDELQIKNNKLELITSLKFHSISRPYNIKYIDDNILLAKSEFINGFEGYSTIIGIEKYDLNYWRNIKL